MVTQKEKASWFDQIYNAYIENIDDIDRPAEYDEVTFKDELISQLECGNIAIH